MGENGIRDDDDDEKVEVNIYPLNSYYFGSKEDAIPSKDHSLQRFKSNYDARGMRTCVEAVMMVELFKHPHLLLFQIKNSIFKLPGGRLRPGESDTDGLKRKLARKLSADENLAEWEVLNSSFLFNFFYVHASLQHLYDSVKILIVFMVLYRI
ncbi:nucleotide hydrolase [Medicago truncatula]|uniref:Nucleotide hydrolase n=1 Tax=Medicago truncatula TaxID=3880 RepID=A0A072V824_MEDTR|nr:nucleotide hydrolase [Medicago truncatula]